MHSSCCTCQHKHHALAIGSIIGMIDKSVTMTAFVDGLLARLTSMCWPGSAVVELLEGQQVVSL